LRGEALELAAAVLEDGQPRLLGPLNSYERRIVHVALAEDPRVRTFSVGEGSDRRVTIAPAEPGSSGG
jgi:spoIIIJ-associated protein